MVQVYKPLKRLISAFDKKTMEIEQEKQLRLQHLVWHKENIIKQSILDGVYGTEQRLAIENDFIQKKAAIELEADQKTKRQKIDNQNEILNATSSALNSIGQIADAFAGDDEERAKKAFNINKGLGIAQAIIATSQGIMNAYVNPLDVASGVAFAKSIGIGLAGAAQIATIATTKFQPAGGGATTTPTTTTPTNGGTSPSQAPSFNVVGQSGFNQIAGALGQQQPVQAFVVAGAVTNAQQLQNNTIQTATF